MTKIYKPNHEEPGGFCLNYILLPYGEYYNKTKMFQNAQPGETLRFFNGPDVVIDRVLLLRNIAVIDTMCRMRYGISWDKAFAKWLAYARMEGNGKDILDPKKCYMVVYANPAV